MGKDFIDFLIENPQEIPAVLKNEKEKYGIHASHQLEAAIHTRKRMREAPDTKGIAEKINAETRAIAGGDFHSEIEVFELQQTPKEEVNEVAKLINQGTSDILYNPGMSPNEAVTLGILRREIQKEQ